MTAPWIESEATFKVNCERFGRKLSNKETGARIEWMETVRLGLKVRVGSLGLRVGNVGFRVGEFRA